MTGAFRKTTALLLVIFMIFFYMPLMSSAFAEEDDDAGTSVTRQDGVETPAGEGTGTSGGESGGEGTGTSGGESGGEGSGTSGEGSGTPTEELPPEEPEIFLMDLDEPEEEVVEPSYIITIPSDLTVFEGTVADAKKEKIICETANANGMSFEITVSESTEFTTPFLLKDDDKPELPEIALPKFLMHVGSSAVFDEPGLIHTFNVGAELSEDWVYIWLTVDSSHNAAYAGNYTSVLTFHVDAIPA